MHTNGRNAFILKEEKRKLISARTNYEKRVHTEVRSSTTAVAKISSSTSLKLNNNIDEPRHNRGKTADFPIENADLPTQTKCIQTNRFQMGKRDSIINCPASANLKTHNSQKRSVSPRD